MDPASLALILSLAGGALKANASRQAAAAQAAQDRYNAHIAQMAAGDAVARGDVSAENVVRQTGEAVSSGEASLAASGVDVTSGSALDTLASQRARGTMAALIVKNNAAREAWGYQQQATNDLNRAKYDEQAGSNAFIESLIGGASSAINAGRGTGLAGGGVAAPSYNPGITSPVIRVGEPTVPESWMTDPMAAWQPGIM